MNGHEQNTKIEISPEELSALSKSVKDFVEAAEFKEYEPFVIEGINFQILWVRDSSDRLDTSYNVSTEIDGFDINIPENIKENDKKRQIFHEILEVCLREKGFSADEADVLTIDEEYRVLGERKPLR